MNTSIDSCNLILKQESPPAWTQEAYRPPCSEYSFCPGRGGGVPDRVPPLGGPGTPPRGDLDPPRGGSGYPRGVWVPPGGSGYPPHCLMAFWEMLQSIMGYGYPPLWTDRWMDGRTDACQNITFPRTPYAGGNYHWTAGFFVFLLSRVLSSYL